MIKNGKRMEKTLGIGDSAVDGLFSGMLAGLFMEIYLILSGWFSGLSLVDALIRISPIQGLPPASSVLLHFSVSGIYGLLFGLAVYWLARNMFDPKWLAFGRPLQWWGWLIGLVYGMILLAVAVLVVLPDSASPMGQIPFIHLIFAHLVYGLVLGTRIQIRA